MDKNTQDTTYDTGVQNIFLEFIFVHNKNKYLACLYYYKDEVTCMKLEKTISADDTRMADGQLWY